MRSSDTESHGLSRSKIWGATTFLLCYVKPKTQKIKKYLSSIFATLKA